MSDLSKAVIADGASAYWRMGEASGALVDAIAANNTTVQTALTYAQAGALLGDADTAISYNGTTSTATAPSNAAFDLGNGPLTVECWLKRSAVGATSTFLNKGSTGGTAWIFFFPADNTVRFARADTAASIMDSGAFTISDTTTWHHIVATKNGATRKLYVDGVDRTSLATDFTLANSTSVQSIGTANFGGLLDEVALYKVELSFAQVLNHWVIGRQLYEHIHQFDPTDLIAMG